MSPSFQLGSAHVGNVPGNTSQYLYNTVYNDTLFFSCAFNKYGIAPSGKPLSLYNASYKNDAGLPDVSNYLSYITWKLLTVPSGNSYHTNITLVGRFL